MPRRPAREIPRRLVGKQTVKRKGKADPLLGDSWQEWLGIIKDHGPMWLYAATIISHACCLRITETLMLTAESFDWYRNVVVVPPLKGQEETEKVMPSRAVTLFNDWWRNGGLRVSRMKKQGNRGIVPVEETWTWPAQGYLFPATRKDSKLKRRTKDSVAKQIAKLRKNITNATIKKEKVRSHSARHRSINDMKAAGIDHEVGKQYARIRDDGVWAGYGRLSAFQAGTAMHNNHALQMAWVNAIPGPGNL
ncbi:unnamed protein product [Symbiodinium natans]|uniref:Tyr recombinase domain-containing protein n=1 Tax=Symbiodinium natans TaxID=878477 RepID=A0A812IJH7_9DINO|nr:unnamed protein product [Symbiodinium natans]